MDRTPDTQRDTHSRRGRQIWTRPGRRDPRADPGGKRSASSSSPAAAHPDPCGSHSAGYGAVWWSVRGQHPYSGPTLRALSGGVRGGDRRGPREHRDYQARDRGVSGQSRRQRRAFGAAFGTAWIAVSVFQGALYHDGRATRWSMGSFRLQRPCSSSARPWRPWRRRRRTGGRSSSRSRWSLSAPVARSRDRRCVGDHRRGWLRHRYRVRRRPALAAARDGHRLTTDALDPLIHVPARLRIVATLAALPDGDALSFTRLQDMIGLTPGNLITHLRKLGDAGYLSTDKTGNGAASRTSVALTSEGRAAFGLTPSVARSRWVSRRPMTFGPLARLHLYKECCS